MGSRLIYEDFPFRTVSRQDAYTLVELIAVVALIGILLAFAVPRFGGSLLTDSTGKTTRWIMMQVRNLREATVRSQLQMTLHISPDDGVMWVTDETLEEDAVEDAAESGYRIPDNVTVTDVEYPDGKSVTYDRADIRFSRHGISDKVIIHIENDAGRRMSLLIEPFLPGVKIYEEEISFDD